MEADDKTKYRNASAAADKYRDASPDDPDVEAHKFVTDEPAEDEADKTKMKTKYRSPKARDEGHGKY